MDVFYFVAVTILEHLLILCQKVKKPCWCCWFEEGEDPLTIYRTKVTDKGICSELLQIDLTPFMNFSGDLLSPRFSGLTQ
jgi:hypothetical protein